MEENNKNLKNIKKKKLIFLILTFLVLVVLAVIFVSHNSNTEETKTGKKNFTVDFDKYYVYHDTGFDYYNDIVVIEFEMPKNYKYYRNISGHATAPLAIDFFEPLIESGEFKKEWILNEKKTHMGLEVVYGKLVDPNSVSDNPSIIFWETYKEKDVDELQSFHNIDFSTADKKVIDNHEIFIKDNSGSFNKKIVYVIKCQFEDNKTYYVTMVVMLPNDEDEKFKNVDFSIDHLFEIFKFKFYKLNEIR